MTRLSREEEREIQKRRIGFLSIHYHFRELSLTKTLVFVISDYNSCEYAFWLEIFLIRSAEYVSPFRFTYVD